MVKLNTQEKKQKIQEEHAHDTNKVKLKDTKTKAVKIHTTLEDLNVIYYPLVTEKAVNMIDSENKITFVVSDKANKNNVKSVVEKTYNVKVKGINIIRDRKGRKKAIIRLAKENKAQDLATKLGVL